MHSAVSKHDVLVIFLKNSDHFCLFYRMDRPFLRICTQQYNPYILPISNSIFTSNNNIKCHNLRKTDSKKQKLEHKCILQECCKTSRRWQRYILLVRGDHCVGD